jgi:type II secretory pathway pseudopilin PulG
MPMTRSRTPRGGTLLELLVALPLAALLAAVAAATLLGSWRLVRRGDASLGSMRELRHAQAVLVSELRPLRARDLRAASDSALEFDALLGTGVVCASATGAADRVEVAAPDPADPRGISWASSVQVGDILTLWRTATAGEALLREHRTTVQGIAWGAACATSPWLAGWADRRTVRLTLSDPSPTPLAIGAALSAYRPTRLSLYRSATGWFLGKRTRNSGAWDVIQPVAGPFLSAGQGGMTTQVIDAAGTVAGSLVAAAGIRVELRADRTADGRAAARRDTAVFDVVLRAESAHRAR